MGGEWQVREERRETMDMEGMEADGKGEGTGGRGRRRKDGRGGEVAGIQWG